MGLITNMRSRMQVVMWTILVLFVTSMAIGGLVGGASITDIFGGRQGNEVGSVNGKPITIEEYNQSMSNAINSFDPVEYNLLPDVKKEQLKDEVWQNLIQQRLISEQIIENKIVISDEEVLFQMKNNPPLFLQYNDAFQSFGRFDLEKYLDAVLNPGENINWKPIEEYMQNFYLPQNKLYNYIVNAAAVSPEDISQYYKERFLNYKIEILHVTDKNIEQDENYKSQINNRPSEEELKNLYNENINDYNQPELRHLKYVKWPIKSNATDTLRVKLEAEDLIFRLNNGEDFALLANTYTEDPNNSRDSQNLKGGDLGWFNKGQLLPEFEIASFEAEKGSVVGPILTQYGYHIIKVNDKRIVDGNEQVNTSHILLTIQPGKGTINDLESNANIFVLDATEYGFISFADSLGYEIHKAHGIEKESVLIEDFGSAKSAAFFAFNNDKGAISEVIKNDNFVAVFFLDSIEKKKILKFENVRNDVEKEFNRKFKKDYIKLLAQSLKGSNTDSFNLSKIADENPRFEYIKESSSNLIGSFDSIGQSNFVVGALKNAEIGKVYGPLPTIRGQAFIKVIEIEDINSKDFEEKKNIIKESLIYNRQKEIWTNWLISLKEQSNIKDYRFDLN